jgi:hypothetical protein
VIVVGFLGGADAPADSDDFAVEVARRAADTGARVEMVGAAAPGPAGDKRLLELAAAEVGHATVIRSGADSLDPADLHLALRYLPEIRAVVLVRPPARLVAASVSGADFAGAALVLVGPLDATALAALDAVPNSPSPESAGVSQPIVLDPPARDPDGTFAGFVAALATRLDAGEQPDAAFRATVSQLAVDPA